MTLHAIDLTGEAYHHYVDEIDTLHELAAMLPAHPVVVNIGACFGTSAIAILEARPDAFVFSVDVRRCDSDGDEAQNLVRAGMAQWHRCIRVLGRSQDAGVHWPGYVDMVFVDGSHATEDVIADAAVWVAAIRRKAGRGAVIAFHDYGNPICPNVKAAVDRAMAGYEPFLERGFIVAYRVEGDRFE
jgi:predicted O-methyltransferase YrrM